MAELNYIVDLETKEQLEFTYIPESIHLNSVPSLSENIPIGRNEPIFQATGGKQTCSFRLEFYAKDTDVTAVKYAYEWLNAMRYISNGKPASQIQIIFGDVFKAQRWVLTKCDVDYKQFIKAKGWLPRRGVIDIGLTEVSEEPLTKEDVRSKRIAAPKAIPNPKANEPTIAQKYVYELQAQQAKELETKTFKDKVLAFLNDPAKVAMAYRLIRGRGNPIQLLRILPFPDTPLKKLESIKSGIFDKLINETRVELTNLGLEKLPYSIVKLTNMKDLFLTGNNFSVSEKNKIINLLQGVNVHF